METESRAFLISFWTVFSRVPVPVCGAKFGVVVRETKKTEGLFRGLVGTAGDFGGAI